MSIPTVPPTSQAIRLEIEDCFGFFPPFFEPALATPTVLLSLWQQTQWAYLHNPLPALFKEKLAALLARYCSVPYCLICHSASLRPLGMAASEILQLLQTPVPALATIHHTLASLPAPAVAVWPEPDSAHEEQILLCAVAVFQNSDSHCQERLRASLSTEDFQHLTHFLLYNRTCLSWAEAHPTLSYQADRRVQEHLPGLLEEVPALADFFSNYSERVQEQEQRRLAYLREESLRRGQLEQRYHELERRFQAVVQQAPVAIALLSGPELRYEFYNSYYLALVGTRQLQGLTVSEAFPELEGLGYAELLSEVYRTGVPHIQKEARVELRRNGVLEETFQDFSYTPLLGDDDQAVGVLVVAHDVTVTVQARRTVSNQEAWMRAVLDDLPAGLIMMNPQTGERLFANRKAIAKDWLDLNDYWLSAGRPQVLTNVGLVRGEPGQEQSLNINVATVPAQHGHETAVLLAANDVSQLRSTELALRAHEVGLALALDVARIGFWSYHPPSGEVIVSDQFCENWGLTEEMRNNFTYEKAVALVHEDDREELRQAVEQALTEDRPYFCEYRVRRADTGAIVWIEARGHVVRSRQGEIVRMVGTSQNVSDRKGYRNQLQVTLDEARRDAQEQRQMSAELTSARHQAEEASRTKSAFLANMSHEIRTPLAAILGYTEILKQEGLEESDRREFLDTISRNGESLTRLLDDILDLSKVEAGQIEPEWIDFSPREMLGDLEKLFAEQARSKSLSMLLSCESSVPERVCSDPTRLRQILINLLGNALKFTARGEVIVAVSCPQSHLLRIRVRDTGIGLDEGQASRLFRPFSQADNSTTRRFGGTGLGLVLSRRLARLLGGDVRLVWSEIGAGCEFQATIQLQPTEAPEQVAESDEVELEILRGQRVLVVEDLPDNQRMVRHLLERLGLIVDLAEDGLQGIEKAVVGDYSIILMDMQMPKMDGFTATQQLRATGYTGPIVALTAHAMLEDRQRIQACGCDAHLTKPLQLREMTAVLVRYCSKLNG